MKNIFNDSKQIIKSNSDLAHNLTLYSSLAKSDAFLYIPLCDEKNINEYLFKKIYSLPNPTNKKEYFTTIDTIDNKPQQSNIQNIYGFVEPPNDESSKETTE